ncbi:MAG: glycosyltransferase [Oscillospiraceae bacterium]|nr:glycosyltransferase [Oscillospiraceae bacterium]
MNKDIVNTQDTLPVEEIKVSVVLPVYKVEQYIERCIDSLLNQTLKEMEFIFIDDCGGDSSIELVEKAAAADDRIKILYNETNLGTGRSRNRGIEAARGKYIGFVDPDDTVDLDFYEKLFCKAEQFNCDVVKGNRVKIYDDGSREDDTLTKRFYDYPEVSERSDWFIPFSGEHQSAIYRNDIIKKYGIRNGTSMVSQDTTFVLRMMLHTRTVAFCRDTCYNYYVIKGSASNTHSREYFEAYIKQLNEKIESVNSGDADIEFQCAYVYKILKYAVFFVYDKMLAEYNDDISFQEFYLNGIRQEALKFKSCNRLADVPDDDKKRNKIWKKYITRILNGDFNGLTGSEGEYNLGFLTPLSYAQTEDSEPCEAESEKRTVPVVFITDEKYAMPTAVAITSLFYNASESVRYNVYILCTGVGQNSIDMLEKLSRDGHTVNIVVEEEGKYADICATKFKDIHVSAASIFKFELPNIFSEYDKILYLDSDMLILDDLGELFDEDLTDRYAAVVNDIKVETYSPPQLNRLNLENKHKYYWNSGMMLLNLKKMREDNITEKLFEYRENGINYFMDQDALNVVFEENVVYVPFRYNMLYTNITIFDSKKLCNYYNMESYSGLKEIIDRAAVLHLTGPYKPWEHLMPFVSDLFCFYYEKSPYSGQPLTLIDNDPVCKDEPTTKPDSVPVVYVCDVDSARKTSVSVTSLYLNKKPDTNYDIYIFCNKISFKHKLRLNALGKDGFKVKVIDICEYDYQNCFDQMGNAVSPETLVKFRLPELMPEYDKIIYLSNDTLVLKDLTALYTSNIGANYAGAVRDHRTETYNPTQLNKLCLPHRYYFSVGMLLLNLKKMREDRISEKLLCYKKYGVNYLEADPFNVCFEDKVEYLPFYFNCIDNVRITYKKEDFHKKVGIEKFYSYAELYSRSYVIFFNSSEKPWNDLIPNLTDMYLRYYLRSTYSDWPYGNKIGKYIRMIRANEKCMVCPEFAEADYYFFKNVTKAIYPQNKYSLYVSDYEQRINECVAKYSDISSDGFNRRPREKRIVVSLTTIPFRVEAAAKVISIMLHQTMKPDAIVLYLGKELFGDSELPELLKKEMECGVSVEYREDLICHTKYFYAMQDYPDDIVITVDDDIVYSEDLIETLYKTYCMFPNAVSALRVHQMTFNSKNEIAPYDKWKICNSDHILVPSLKLLALGVGGVLYPPHLLPEETFNLGELKRLSPRADDLWLKIMELKKDIPVVLARRYEPLTYIEGTQEVRLCDTNFYDDKNDVQMAELIKAYNVIEDNKTLVGKLLDETVIPVHYIERKPNTISVMQVQIERFKSDAKKLNDKLKKADEEAKSANTIIISETETLTKEMAVNELTEKRAQNRVFESRARFAEEELANIRSSLSFKIGRFATWLPRKIRALFKGDKG